MREPSIDLLLTKVDSKYSLVVATAKRARELIDEDKALVETKSTKPVTIALEEIAAEKISYNRNDEGIK